MGSSQLINQHNQAGQSQKSTGRHNKQEHGFGTLFHKAPAEYGTRSQHFSHQAEQCQRQSKTDSHSQSIKNRLKNRVFGSKSLCPTQNQTIDHNQRNKNAECGVQIWKICRHQQVNNRNKSCRNHNIARNPHFIRNQIFQKRDNAV